MRPRQRKAVSKTYLVYAGNQHVGWRPTNSNGIIKIVFFKSCGLHVAQLQLFMDPGMDVSIAHMYNRF